ncbi:hypothetical protein BS47DRAFT_1352264 [Hydnum rufescens UP504]|nr:hypothetical protein BS47DRAFT_1352264 [Hydnum rufescens UP504]
MISRRQEHTIVLHASRIVIPAQSICGLTCTHSNPLPMDAIRLTIQFELVNSLVDSVVHGNFVPDEYHKPY